MGRTVDHIERISDSFDTLDTMTQADMVSELFGRLSTEAKDSAKRRIDLRLKLEASIAASKNGEMEQ